MKLILRSLLFVASINTLSVHADIVHIAVASNFTHTMKELITAFEQSSSHKVKASYGSSGKIFAQIKHGAPFQIFFSADQAKPLALYDESLTSSPPFTYALGALALWSSNAEFKQQELKYLQAGKFNKLSFANPKLAPYGNAAMEVLEKLNLVEATRKKWIQGENIAQAYQFVGTGNADLGFVALSQVINKSTYWPVPNSLYQSIKQDAVMLKSNRNKNAAKAFIRFIRNQQGQAIINAYGYGINEASSADRTGLKK